MEAPILPAVTREVKCARCGAVNRVGAYGVDRVPRCGKCHQALPEPLGKRFLRRVVASRRMILLAAIAGGLVLIKPTIFTEWFSIDRQSDKTSLVDACSTYPQPFTSIRSVYDVSERVAPLTIKTRSGGGYFVKLEEAGTRRPIMSFYLRGGEILEEQVPEGSFVLKYATGDRWCGETRLFGPTTTVKQADQIFAFEEGQGYTVELIARKGGNLRTMAIDRNQF